MKPGASLEFECVAQCNAQHAPNAHRAHIALSLIGGAMDRLGTSFVATEGSLPKYVLPCPVLPGAAHFLQC